MSCTIYSKIPAQKKTGKILFQQFLKIHELKLYAGSWSDGRYGFGGACFPKDLNAFVNFAISKNVSLDLLETVIKINNNIRGTYKTITNREKAQNINFSSED